MRWPRRRDDVYLVQADAALAADGSATGLGVIVRNARGRILRWVSRRGPGMTNNEAEYAALCLALEVLAAEKSQAVHVYSDSEIVVNQMRGRFRVNSADLRRWHHQACQLARRIPVVTFTHIPRERNRLADALANEALLPVLPVPERET